MLATAAPRRILAAVTLVMIGAAVFGLPVIDHLSAGGFEDPNSESARASELLADTFHQSDQQLVITVTTPQGATSSSARAAALGIVEKLRASPHVLSVTSLWTEPATASSGLLSKDGKTGLIVANLAGGRTPPRNMPRNMPMNWQMRWPSATAGGGSRRRWGHDLRTSQRPDGT
ncbi:MMPL family protein [Mycobacterium kansasii 824]|nr:MMPL family protein [Mycobacterium kansasii 824]